jgi:hypothetical protein
MGHFPSNLTGKLHAFSAVCKRLQSGLIRASVLVLESLETCEFNNAIHVMFKFNHAQPTDKADQFIFVHQRFSADHCRSEQAITLDRSTAILYSLGL